MNSVIAQVPSAATECQLAKKYYESRGMGCDYTEPGERVAKLVHPRKATARHRCSEAIMLDDGRPIVIEFVVRSGYRLSAMACTAV
jgi:hypothetical protein